jgi:hypothetical protein
LDLILDQLGRHIMLIHHNIVLHVLDCIQHNVSTDYVLFNVKLLWIPYTILAALVILHCIYCIN